VDEGEASDDAEGQKAQTEFVDAYKQAVKEFYTIGD
jgi:hypothetical protein